MADIVVFFKRLMVARLFIHAVLVLSFVVSGLIISLGDGGKLTIDVEWKMGVESVGIEESNTRENKV